MLIHDCSDCFRLSGCRIEFASTGKRPLCTALARKMVARELEEIWHRLFQASKVDPLWHPRGASIRCAFDLAVC